MIYISYEISPKIPNIFETITNLYVTIVINIENNIDEIIVL